jgi:oligopeptide transport system ATP-binding protein
MKTLLEVQDLHVSFLNHGQPLQAVSGVDFIVREGETLGIVGESGCGKSATAKALVKLFPSHNTSFQGQVLYEGQNLLLFTERQMQNIRGKEIGMIFQDPMTSLNPTLKIGTQIIEGYRRHHPDVSYSMALSYAIEMLELVGIPQASQRIHEYPHTLSGGMRQRVMIALALACKPKLLIADEPTTALDVTIQAQILSLMKTIQQKTQTSIILITHDLSVIAGFCDRVIVMYAGKIVETALVEDLFYRPKHPYTQRLLQAIPKINLPKDQPLIPIEGSPPNLTSSIEGCSFYPRCPHAMNICPQKQIHLVQVSAEHHSRCWLHKVGAAHEE